MLARRAAFTLWTFAGLVLSGGLAAGQTPPPSTPSPAAPAEQAPVSQAPPAEQPRPPREIGIVPPAGIAGPLVSVTGCVVRMDGQETHRPLDQPVTTFFVLTQATGLKPVGGELAQPALVSTAGLDTARTVYGLISTAQGVYLEDHKGHRVEVTGSFRSPAGLGPALSASGTVNGALVPMFVRSLKMVDDQKCDKKKS
jgi:hypothetical protein